MIKVSKIHISPVKSLGLRDLSKVHVGEAGIIEDRRFFLIGSDGNLITQRQIGKITQIIAAYVPESNFLSLKFPDGTSNVENIILGGSVNVTMFGRHVTGNVLEGKWTEKLSNYCGREIRIIQSQEACVNQDVSPISIMSEATIDNLTYLSQGKTLFTSARFRPTLVLSGCHAYEEDEWVGNEISVGSKLRVDIVSRDPRCAITTLNPESGTRDFDTLRFLLENRPDFERPYLGVYGRIKSPGNVEIGDELSTV